MNGEFTVSTDKKEKIKLDSAIVLAQWTSPVAVGGSEAGLEVRTVFVAQGSSIEIKGKSSEGKAPGTVKGKVFNNLFLGKLPIPEKVKPGAQIWFEAKLPKHGLKKESDTAIPAAPQVQVLQLGWDRAEVRRGDIVKLNARFENVLDDADVTVSIYEYDSEGYHDKIAEFSTELAERRLACSWQFQYNRDTADIPTQQELRKYGKNYEQPQFFFVVEIEGIRIGEKQESGLLKFNDYLSLGYTEADGTPIPNSHYKVTFADGSTLEGDLGKDGTARIEQSIPGPVEVEYSVKKDDSNSSGSQT